MADITIKYRRDYQKSAYDITNTRLAVDIYSDKTIVTTELDIQRHADADASAALILDGENQKLLSVSLNDNLLSANEYLLTATNLTLHNVPNAFTLSILSEIHPETNTTLEGLYKTTSMICTQCEAHGFRKITYYLDRPDVMASFTCKISADKTQYPILLSNGNKISFGNLPNNRHYATWHDPFRKPCYLFALVAGDLAVIHDTYQTQSGRNVALEIYSVHADIAKCHYAMEALKHAMRWDEKSYGREYDLDIYMIVATPDFNMGAMENKGLNIFNTKYVLANPKTSTDIDYQNVLTVIGHEYFHNWTGNRITCRDWFQLSLKEGLTVFRDQEFTADHYSRAVKRIEDVKIIRGQQFVEDASPMAHPIRPDSYMEMNNFYTVTVYNKGAEVIRMQQTLLGVDGFRKGMDLYFDRHDGQAVTCDDFVKAMEDANERDLTQFKLWYNQAGTPIVKMTDHYDEKTKTYTLHMTQSCPPTANQLVKLPFHIPIKVGLIDPFGKMMSFDYQSKNHTTHLLELKEPSQCFVLNNVIQKPVPSLLQDFSAPIKVDYPYTDEQLLHLYAYDQNELNRWDAGQTLAAKLILQLAENWQQNPNPSVPNAFISAIRNTLLSTMDKAFIAEAITLPHERVLAEMLPITDPESLHRAREFMLYTLASHLKNEFLNTYQAIDETGPYEIEHSAIAKRKLKNVCLSYLLQLPDDNILQLGLDQFMNATNMTDQLAALINLNNGASFAEASRMGQKSETIEIFYRQWQHEDLVVDKWLMAQAQSKHPDTYERVKNLLTHPAFDYKNPNKVYALLVTYGNNLAQFHLADGSGYKLIAEQIAIIDSINPQVASRLARSLMNYKRYVPHLRDKMHNTLTQLAEKKLSKDVYEIVSKSLT